MTKNLSEYYTYDSLSNKFNANSKMISGNFTMSYNAWGTAFEKIGNNGDYSSKYFQDFLNYRITIARRLALERANSKYSSANNYNPNPSDTGNRFPDGYVRLLLML